MFFVPSYSKMTILPESEATTSNFSDQKNMLTRWNENVPGRLCNPDLLQLV